MVEGAFGAYGEDSGSDLKGKIEDAVSLFEAMHAIIHGTYPGLERQRFPKIEMIIVLDILSTSS